MTESPRFRNFARRHRRVLLAATIAGLFALILWQTAVWTRSASLQGLMDQGWQNLNLYIANVERELEKYEILPELLATDPHLLGLLKHPGEPDRVDAVNRRLERLNGITGASDTYLMDRTGLTLAASNWNSGTPFVGENFSYRPYFQEAMRGGLGRFFALGTTSNKRGYYFAFPVREAGAIRGVVVVKVNINALESRWGGDRFEFLVTDPDGVIFSSSRPDWKFNTLHSLEPDQLRHIRANRRYSDLPLPVLPVTATEDIAPAARLVRLREDGTRRAQAREFLELVRPMPSAGWNVHILTGLEPVHAQVLRAVLTAAFLFALLLLTSLILVQRRLRLRERSLYELRSKKVLEANELRVRTIIHNTHAGLITTDGRGTIESFNPTAEQLFGYRSEEIRGAHITRLLAPGDRAGLQCELDRSPLSGCGSVEVAGLRKDHSRFPTELAVREMRIGAERKFIATVHDISELKRTEDALRRAHDMLETRVQERTADLSRTNARLTREIEEHRRTEDALRHTQNELIQAAKLAVLGQLATGVSHELNQPLAAIRTYADNARALLDQQRSGDARWNLEQIASLTDRMAQISAQLKVFARKTSGRSVPVSVSAAVEAALGILTTRIRALGAEVRCNLPAGDLMVRGDAVRLEQVLVNLVNNALQAMEGNEQPRLEIAAAAHEGRVDLVIRDNGPGIPEELVAQVFDPFFTTKETGLGLGLSISKRITEEMGGALLAGRAVDGGAEFTLELPRAESADRESAIG